MLFVEGMRQDSDTDSNTETDTMPEGFVGDAGPWEWTDFPDAGDCDVEGCKQLTFGDSVDLLEWDVWGDLLVVADDAVDKTLVVNCIDNKYLEIPNVFPSISDTSSIGVFYPATIYEQMVCYGQKVYSEDDIENVICANLEAQTQILVYCRKQNGPDSPNPAKYSDLYGTRFVSMGGCGDVMDSWPLCEFDTTEPGTYQELAPHFYGSHNSMWGDIVVWYTEIDGYHIQAYDFSTSTQFNITDDDEVQFNPRIHGSRVVYQDLRFGDGGSPMASWAHSAVFMYDLGTHETTQITSGEWIAAYPDVHENIIVWADYRASADPNDAESFSGVEIWGYNVDTETEFQITNIPGRGKTTPRIWGDKVFVQMYKASGGDAIYMFDLPDGAK